MLCTFRKENFSVGYSDLYSVSGLKGFIVLCTMDLELCEVAVKKQQMALTDTQVGVAKSGD